MFALLFTALIVGILDFYTSQAVKTAFPKQIRWFWGFHLLLYLSIPVYVLLASVRGWGDAEKYLFFSLFSTFYFPKLIMLPFLVAEDLGIWVKRWTRREGEVLPTPAAAEAEASPTMSRATFLSRMALATASLPFGGMIYAISYGKYDYHVHKIKVRIKDLPAAFEGFRITQVSDLHTGSYDNKDAFARGLELANRQGSDIICFTGDLINDRIDEVAGFEKLYQSLEAPAGVFSVLGNHDYGRHVASFTEADLLRHMNYMEQAHADFGWHLLKNDSVVLEKNGAALALVGVENWSAQGYFPRLGRLDQALKNCEQVPAKVLMSHDPSHWEAEVWDHPGISLMMAGHTHGCQFGFEIPGFQWSPIQYVYRQWAGLYSQGHQSLYVNRGMGFAGFSGRLGIPPEITVLELHPA